MKRIMMFGLCVWLLAIGKATADNTLSVANVTIPQGGQVTLEIVCDFSTTYVGGQLDLELGEDGKVTPTMSGGKPIATFGFTGTDHSISSSQLKDAEEQLLQKYRFVFTSMSSSALPASGTLLSIVLNASDDAVVGTVYNVKVSNIELGTAGSEKTNIDDIPFTVTIGDPLPTVTLNETSTSSLGASEGSVNVTVNRTIIANNWSTICLPFDMGEDQVKTAFGDDVELADFTSWSFEGTANNVESITIGFTEVTEIEKNHPYIIKVSNGITSFTVNNVEIDPEDDPETTVIFKKGSGKTAKNYEGSMYGVYQAKEADEYDIFLANNQFWYSRGGTNINAYRATFWFGDIILHDVSSSRIVMSFGESESTGISAVLVRNNEVKSEVYNLNGQRINVPTRGIYVKNGKKVLIK